MAADSPNYNKPFACSMPILELLMSKRGKCFLIVGWQLYPLKLAGKCKQFGLIMPN